MLLIGCSRDDDMNYQSGVKESTFITENEALKTLQEFLNETESEMPLTKSGGRRLIASIAKHYVSVATKSGDSVDSINAYVVNFANDGGFAVLGASTTQPAIIALTEQGYIESDSLEVYPSVEAYNYSRTIVSSSDTTGRSNFNWYCAADDDYYVGVSIATIDGELLSTFVSNGTSSGNGYSTMPGHYAEVDNGSTNSNGLSDDTNNTTGPSIANSYLTVSPMLKTNWNQSEPYNRYCWFGITHMHALAGCSVTALSMIMAYNMYPDTLIVNGSKMDWNVLNTTGNISACSNTQSCEEVKLLLGGLYNICDKVVFPGNGTMITPEQIKKKMSGMGYSNVAKISRHSFTNYMQDETRRMLSEGKPVFISALGKLHIKLNLIKSSMDGHSWVIDGVKYKNNSYLYHCNWGWSGNCNGYYSANCFDTGAGEEYDSGTSSADANGNFYWHFRLLTYDVPSVPNKYFIIYTNDPVL